MNSVHQFFARARVTRTTEGRILGGVCSGLGAWLHADPWAMRLLVLALMIVVPGSPILLYPLAWVLLPDEHRAAAVLHVPPAPAEVGAKMSG